MLTNVQRQRCTITATALDEYQTIVLETIAETKQSLLEVNCQLASFSKEGSAISSDDIPKMDQLYLEKKRCEDDIEALSQVLAILGRVEVEKFDTNRNSTFPVNVTQTNVGGPPKQLTVTELRDFMERIPPTISELKDQLSSIEDKVHPFWHEHMALRQKLLDEKQNDESSLKLLQKVNEKVKDKKQNVFRDISVAQSADQAIISEVGDLLHCRNINAGARARQCLGQMTGESFQAWCRQGRADVDLEQKDAFHVERWTLWMIGGVSLNLGLVAWILNHGI